MARVERIVAAPVEQIFEVLSDGWSYSDWVVGTVHVRDVDQGWPRPGTSIHHKVGPWPLSLHDGSTVLRCDAPHRLVLRAGLGPLGAAVITFTLTSVDSGATRVSVVEHFVAGPISLMNNKINDLLLHMRNREMLRRLADIATRRQRDRGSPVP